MAVIQETSVMAFVLKVAVRDKGDFAHYSLPLPSEQRTQKNCLISAAGVTAELLIYPGRDSERAGADRKDFDSSEAPSFDQTANEAYGILSRQKTETKETSL